MISRPRHIKYVPFILLVFFLAVTTTISSAQTTPVDPQTADGNSNIEICFRSNGLPGEVNFSGDLGEFFLVYPYKPCHAAYYLDPGTYTINETLPPDWYPWREPSCEIVAGTGISQWRTTPLSVTIDLAGESSVKCTFYSLEDSNEPNDTMAQATLTTYGGEQDGYTSPHNDVGPDGDRDFFRFQGYAGDKIYVRSEIWPYMDSIYIPWMVLMDKNGSILTEAYQYGGPVHYLIQELPLTGTYYLVVGSPCTFDTANCMGGYVSYLTIYDPYEPNDTKETATPITYGDILRARIFKTTCERYEDQDEDFFRFTGDACIFRAMPIRDSG